MPKLLSIEDLYDVYLKHPKISTDTRSIESNSLFFALKGQNFDGNKFSHEALKAGAAYAIIDDVSFDIFDNTILVDDVLTTLQNLANYHRKQLKIPFLAITGSNGKTTTKELIAAVLSKKYKCLATKGNLNNHIGVPLTLLSITPDIEFAIIEMGANHQKEIEDLCAIAMPDYGIITNIGKAHLEGFGGIEGVKKGKGEMYDFIKKNGGKVFVNANDEVLKEMMLQRHLNAVLYGTVENLDLTGRIINDQPTLEFSWKWKNMEIQTVKTNMPGAYNIDNFLCAACVGSYFGVEVSGINEALSNYISDNNRSQIVVKNNKTILLDAYNANPSSMEAAILNFTKVKAEKKAILLGNMLELGADSDKEHQKLVELLEKNNFSEVYLVGTKFKNINKHYYYFDNVDTCSEFLKNKDFTNYHLLIKGSRGSKMEKLLDVL
jgi:UDP-N-acetylmuramoyl-tripeptide--D-alanyl-D-alanine ligase